MTTLLLLAAFAQVQDTTQTPASPLSTLPAYAEVNRLAITPKIDGRLEAEEWDPLMMQNTFDSYFQWEPSKVHVAAKAAMGQDILVSLDLKGDGWHAGSDNLELRFKWNGTVAEVTARRMVMSGTEGPSWIDASDYKAALVHAASSDGSSWTLEATVEDPGFPFIGQQAGGKVGVRIDGIFATEAPMEAYLPRAVPFVNMVMDRGNGLPVGLRWKPEFKGRSTIAGEDIKIRFAFDGTEGMNTLRRIDVKTDGPLGQAMSSQGFPFPEFDRKNRAFVDYSSKVSEDSPIGWRVARATITTSDDRPVIIQSSYEVAEPVTFDFNDTIVTSSNEQQSVRLSTYIRSNTTRRVSGIFKVIPPLGWSVESGNDKSFALVTPRASKRQVFALKVPAGYKGTAPFKLLAEIGALKAEKTVWLVVQ